VVIDLPTNTSCLAASRSKVRSDVTDPREGARAIEALLDMIELH
jgi:hypothetical protein